MSWLLPACLPNRKLTSICLNSYCRYLCCGTNYSLFLRTIKRVGLNLKKIVANTITSTITITSPQQFSTILLLLLLLFLFLSFKDNFWLQCKSVRGYLWIFPYRTWLFYCVWKIYICPGISVWRGKLFLQVALQILFFSYISNKQ